MSGFCWKIGVCSCLISVAAVTEAKDITNLNHGVVYDAMKDLEEVSMQDLHEYDTITQAIPVEWPSVIEPFGFSPDYFTSLPDANPADGVELVSMPYSNGKGDVLLSYNIFRPAAHHHLSPRMTVSYNSSRGIGNMGVGWNLDLPCVETDTMCEANEQGKRFLLNGKRIAYVGMQGDTAQIYRYQVNPGNEKILFIMDKEQESTGRWEYTDSEGVTYRFGQYDKDSVLKDVVWGNPNSWILTWKISEAVNPYGDYVWYRHGKNMSDNDSVFVGNPKRNPHTCIVINGTEKQKKWQGKDISFKQVTRVSILTAKEKPRGNDKWINVREYAFRYRGTPSKLDSLLSYGYKIMNDGSVRKQEYKHSFEYYADKDSVAKRKMYRNLYHNISLDSLIIDRTDLLKSVHTPLGGCFTVDYAYSAEPDTFGRVPTVDVKQYPTDLMFSECINNFTQKVNDSIQADSLYKSLLIDRTKDVLDSLFLQGVNIMDIPFDTLIQWYFNYTDQHKGKRVLSTFWVNDGVGADGAPSFNRYTYKQPYCDSLGYFIGFEEVSTSHIDTRNDQPIRYSVKHYAYDSIHTELLGKITEHLLYNAGKDNVLKKTLYTWTVTDGPTPNLINIRLTEKRTTIGNYSYMISYEYNNALGTLSKVNHSDGANVHFVHEGKDDGRILLKSIDAKLGVDDNVYLFRDVFEYSTDYPYHLLSHTQGDAKTNFSYDEDWNISQIRFPANAKRDSVICTYRYDRRFNMFLDRVENNLGYRTELEDYIYPYGRPMTVRDINGFELKRTFDAFGRIDTILAPNEQDHDVPFSIVYSYETKDQAPGLDSINLRVFTDSLVLHIPDSIREGIIADSIKAKIIQVIMGKENNPVNLEDWDICPSMRFEDSIYTVSYDTITVDTCRCNEIADPLVASTIRYNAPFSTSDEKWMTTYTLTDGFGRPLQSVRRMSLANVDVDMENATKNLSWVTTQAKTFDPFGRVATVCPPTIHNGNEKNMDDAVYESTDSTLSHDALDRVDTITGTHQFVHVYGDDEGKCLTLSRFSEWSGIPGQPLEEIYYDHRNHLLRKKIPSINAIYGKGNVNFFVDKSEYVYDVLGNVTRAVTPEDDVQYQYDSNGHLVTQSSLLHGKTTYEYGKDGRMTQKTKGDGMSIHYEYRQGLLTKIAYPNPLDNVYLFYGDKNASHNRVGKLALMVDATGAQEYFYGRHGELAKVRRTLVIPNKSIETYVTQFKYDTWNRLAEIIYPDGEMVKYRYNVAGQLEHVWGEKAYIYNYADSIWYDIRGNRVHSKYCNGDETFRKVFTDSTSFTVRNNRSGAEQLHLEEKQMFAQNNEKIDYSGLSIDKSLYVNWTLKEYAEYLNLYRNRIDDPQSMDTLSLTSYHAYDDSARLSVESIRFEQNNILEPGRSEGRSRDEFHYASPYAPDYKQDMVDNSQNAFNTTLYEYDANGNVLSQRVMFLSNPLPESIPVGGSPVLQTTYDAENNVYAESNNGCLSTRWYDGNGALTYMMEASQSAVYVNSVQAIIDGSVDNYRMWVNPYFEKTSDSLWFKHVYIDDRILVSKVGGNASFGADARRVERVALQKEQDYPSLWTNAYEGLSMRFDTLEAQLTEPAKACPELASTSLRNANVDMGNDDYEQRQYYYHYDNQGGIILVTDLRGNVYQLPVSLHTGKLIYNQKNGTLDCTEFVGIQRNNDPKKP